MALFMAAVAVAVASFSWGKYSERQTLLEEYNVFRLSTKAIHMSASVCIVDATF